MLVLHFFFFVFFFVFCFVFFFVFFLHRHFSMVWLPGLTGDRIETPAYAAKGLAAAQQVDLKRCATTAFFISLFTPLLNYPCASVDVVVRTLS